MKKTNFYRVILGLLGFCLFFSCSTDSIEPPNENDDIGYEPQEVVFRTAELAREEVLNFITELYSDDEYTRSSKPVPVIKDCHIVPVSGSLTRSSDEEPLMFIFNFENEAGFTIVSGPEQAYPILAFTEEGSYYHTEPIEKPGFQLFIDMATDHLTAAANGIGGPITQPPVVGPPIKPVPPGEIHEWRETPWQNSVTTGTRVPVQWNQGSFSRNGNEYNKYCPLVNGNRALAGCVMVAAAQIFAYHKYPTVVGGYYMNWNDMTAFPNIYAVSDEAKNNIARLFEILGRPQFFNAHYKPTATSAYTSDMVKVARMLCYSSPGTYLDYDLDIINSNLILRRPVMTSGTRYTISNGVEVPGGHAWVIDQILRQKKTRVLYINGIKQNGSESVFYQSLVHCNWGWGGSYDGFYHNGVFNPKVAGPVITRSHIPHDYRYDMMIVSNLYR